MVNKYRLGRVTKVFPDCHGIVRTVTVALKPRDKRERLLPYKPKALREMTIGVQRLVVFLPVEETRVTDDKTEDTHTSESHNSSDTNDFDGESLAMPQAQVQALTWAEEVEFEIGED